MTLTEWLPNGVRTLADHDHAPVYRHKDVEVTCQHDGHTWPGKHRHVYMWVELANGYAVGWNENPSRGRSFPVVKLHQSQK